MATATSGIKTLSVDLNGTFGNKILEDVFMLITGTICGMSLNKVVQEENSKELGFPSGQNI